MTILIKEKYNIIILSLLTYCDIWNFCRNIIIFVQLAFSVMYVMYACEILSDPNLTDYHEFFEVGGQVTPFSRAAVGFNYAPIN